ncbi:MAG: YCF48-related protein [Deltaproteobacteria bacterium]|nr:YCF48-related protein [Deltaproteobacteria bacterium]
MFRSEDAGNTWSVVTIATQEPLFGIDFVNGRTGWIVGRKGLVFRTDDAGKTWIKQNTDMEDHLFAVSFLDERQGLAVGNFGVVLRTEDGGATWKSSVLEAMSSASIYGVQMFDGGVAYLVGEYPTWEAELEEDVAATTLSSFFRSADGGVTWERAAMPDTSHLFDLAFEDANAGYVAGTKGLVLRTDDGGATWTRVAADTPFHLVKIRQVGDGFAAVGNAGAAVVSDGGSATSVATGAYFWLSSLDFSSKGRGVLVGHHGLITISEDGGRSWRKP